MTELIQDPQESPKEISAEEVGAESGREIAPEVAGRDETVSNESDSGGASADESSSSDSNEGDSSADDSGLLKKLEHEGDIAADYLEELLDIADLDGDLDMDVDGDRAAVSIVGADLQQLVGQDGAVLDALQELTRLAVFRETGERSRLMLDISGFRADLRAELVVRAGVAIQQVKESGEATSLEPMTPFERKVVHDAVAAAGLVSESSGTEPRRYVVVLPS